MKGWKKYSLYHVLNKRWNNKYMKQTMIDFLSGISSTDYLPASVALPVLVLGTFIWIYFGLTIFQSLAIDIALWFLAVGVTSAVDTYHTRKIRIRQSAHKSIRRIMDMKR